MELKFWKYEGVGNDFILIDGREGIGELPGEVVRSLCDRNRGVGADGLMILTNEEGYDFRMRYYNADGGEVSMCGNGGRCIVLFAEHLGIGKTEKYFLGRDGDHMARILSQSDNEAVIELGIIDVDSFQYRNKTFFLNTGVPHYVEFVEKVADVDVRRKGSSIRHEECYRAGGGTNVNFVQIERPGVIRVRTYERGVEGETQACGTGVVASALATHLYAQGDCCDFIVHTPGGGLEVSFKTKDNHHFTDIKLTGPVRRVFTGRISVGSLQSQE